MGSRRKARECGLQILYALETQAERHAPAPPGGEAPPRRLASIIDAEVEQALHDFFAHFDAPARTHGYTAEIVREVLAHGEAIDEVIARHSPRWRIERMAAVDRNILRVATYELLFAQDLPGPTVLDEAIEVAKRFGSERSSAFVNGVLDSILRERRPGEHRDARPATQAAPSSETEE